MKSFKLPVILLYDDHFENVEIECIGVPNTIIVEPVSDRSLAQLSGTEGFQQARRTEARARIIWGSERYLTLKTVREAVLYITTGRWPDEAGQS